MKSLLQEGLRIALAIDLVTKNATTKIFTYELVIVILAKIIMRTAQTGEIMNRNQAIKVSLLLSGLFFVLGCEIPRSSAEIVPNQAPIQTMSLDRTKSQDKLPEYLLILRRADRVDSAAIGFAAIRSDTYKAYERALAAGSSIRPELEDMMQTATPAGRIYAAILLQRLDRSAGEKALQQLQSDRTEITYLNGCIGQNYKVSEFATKILTGEISL